MGGIAGMIRFDGRLPAPADIVAIELLLAHRGPVKSHFLDQGMLLAFEGLLEVNTHAGVYAVADATVFGDGVRAQSQFVESYVREGFSSFNQLHADFAVALWDTSRQTLVFARDLLGVKPLYYVHQPGLFCAFATEIKALLALGEVLVIPNHHKFREYLTWPKAYVPYSAETFYQSVYSVLPGHYLQVTCNEVKVTPYWQPDLSRFSGLKSADDYAALFQEDFTEAINARMLGKSQVGAHLSGGLDSSSVSCVAQQLLLTQGRPSLHTFNIDPGLTSTDESVYVQEVVRQWKPVHHTVQPKPDVLTSILEINRLFDRPDHFIIPSSFHLSVSIRARQIGCDSILTGHDGDSVITTGFDYLDQLIDREDWDQLRHACQQTVSQPNCNLAYVSDHWLSLSERAKFEKYVLHIVGADVVRRFRKEPFSLFIRSLRSQQHWFNLSTTAILTYCINRVKDKIAHRSLIDSAFNPAFRVSLSRSSQPTTEGLSATLSAEPPFSVNQVINSTNVIGNEQLDHIGAYYGHQYSFPFFDKRVVELGLITPNWVSFDQGRGRGLIRHGLGSVLPPAIVNRLTKTNFVEYGNLSARQLYEATREQFSLPDHSIWEIIDRTVFKDIVATVFNPQIPVQQKTRYNWLLSRIIYLSLWLTALELRDVEYQPVFGE